MDCVQGNFACDVQQWLAFAFSWVAEAVSYVVGRFNELIDWLKSQLKELIAIGSFAFAVWKWLRYRDSALFARFRELLEKEERRLRHARSDLLEIICRPAPGQSAEVPLFAEEPLRQIFRRRRWAGVLNVTDPETRADRKLNRALADIDEQIDWGEKRQAFFREQRASVHLLKGAIASARTERVKDDQLRDRLNNEALTHFRDALGVPGNEKDIQAIEYRGHQLLKLGQIQAALLSFGEMEALADALAAGRAKTIYQARARRFQAQASRLRTPPANGRANILMGAALRHLASIAPLFDRDLLDQAEMHEIQGCIRFRLRFPAAANESLEAAKECYQRLLDNLDPNQHRILRRFWRRLRRLFHDDGTDAMRKAAQEGLARVERAVQTGQCDG